MEAKHLEETATKDGNLVYDGEEEPEIHMRTWIALASMFLLNLVQVFALQGPPAVVSGLQLEVNQPLTLHSFHTSARVSRPVKPKHGCQTRFRSFKRSSAL